MATTALKISTKDRILDQAELLFARDGYKATSLRAITEQAGVNLAAVNYHFGSKKDLLVEVIERRVIPLNKLRTACLEEALKRAESEERLPSVEEILRAFVEPTLRVQAAEGDFVKIIALVGHALGDSDDTVREVFIKHMMPVFELLVKSLKSAMPEVEVEDITWRLHFTIGALAHTIRMWCEPELKKSPTFNTEISVDDLLNKFIPFVTAGTERSSK